MKVVRVEAPLRQNSFTSAHLAQALRRARAGSSHVASSSSLLFMHIAALFLLRSVRKKGEMAEGDANGTKSNGLIVVEEEQTLFGALRRLFSAIFFPDLNSSDASTLLQRIKAAVNENASSVREGSRNSTRKLLLWTRRGSPLRALLVVTVGTITFLALTGLLIFMLFFLAATTNAVIISLFMSLAAAGGFLAFFFAFVTAIYIAALSVAIFVISTATISSIIAVLIATAWVGFLWLIWAAAKKSMYLTKHSLSVTASALSAYSTARHAQHQSPEKFSN